MSFKFRKLYTRVEDMGYSAEYSIVMFHKFVYRGEERIEYDSKKNEVRIFDRVYKCIITIDVWIGIIHITWEQKESPKGIDYQDPCWKGCHMHKYHCAKCNTAVSYSPANYASRPSDIPNQCLYCKKNKNETAL